MWVCVCVYALVHTHTHYTDGVLRCEFRSWDETPGGPMEGPKNPNGINLGIHVFVHLYKLHMCMYMLRGRMRSWTSCFFL